MPRDAVDEAREAFGRRLWVAAIAAHLVGEQAGSRAPEARGYRASIERGDPARAARFAFGSGTA